MSTLKKYVLIMAMYLILIVAVFSVSQYSGELTVKARKLRHHILQEKATMSILDAEWAYLNTPKHLESLATHYLKLKPTSARQVISIDDLMAKVKVLDDKDKKRALYLARRRKQRRKYANKHKHKHVTKRKRTTKHRHSNRKRTVTKKHITKKH